MKFFDHICWFELNKYADGRYYDCYYLFKLTGLILLICLFL